MTDNSDRNGGDRRLAPFADNLPYDRDRVIQYGKFQLEQAFVSMYEFGKCLLLIHENEDVATSRQILEEHFGGMSRATAWRYMRFARFAGQFPRFRAMFERPRMLYKGIALIEGLKDPEVEEVLQELEETGKIGDLTETDLLEKSVREYKRENQRLRAEIERRVQETAEPRDKKIKKLEEKVALLEAQVAEPDMEGAMKIIKACEDKLHDVVRLLKDLPRPLLVKERALRQTVFGVVGLLERMVESLNHEAYEAENTAALIEEGQLPPI